MVKGKKGDEKYYILISMILGLIILALSLWFIFYEYFNENEIGLESCKQSVVLRATLPEDFGGGLLSFKSQFPLKCKTQVIEINKKTKDAKQEILDTLVSCWYAFGNGDYSVFPSKFYRTKSVCVPCARIHFDPEVVDDYTGDKKIDLTKALREGKISGKTYYDYFNDVGKKFPAFSPASSRPFNFESGEFKVDEDDQKPYPLKNRLTGEVKVPDFFGIETSKNGLSRVDLPRWVDAKRGDLMIYYGAVVFSEEADIGPYISYLFYFQSGQKNPDPFDELESEFIDGEAWQDFDLCSEMDGIPA